MIRKLLCVVAFSLALTPQAQAETLSRKIALSVTEGFMIPAYTAFAETSSQQAALWETACRGGTAAPLEDLRAAYGAASDSWSRVQHIASGPISLLLRRDRLYHWPERRNAVARALNTFLTAQDARQLEAETFANLSVALQGFPALERLLYDTAYADTPFACQTAQAIARNIAQMARDVAAEWSGTILPLVQKGGGHAFYFSSMEELSNKMFTELLAGYEMIKTQKIGLPMGKSDLESAKPKRAESWRSGRSSRIIQQQATGLIIMTRAFASSLPQENKDMLLVQLSEWELAIGQFPADLPDAVTHENGRNQVRQYQKKQSDTRALTVQLFQQDLGLSVGFNSLDGD